MTLEMLQFLANVAIFPALGYIIALERRIVRIEVLLSEKLDNLPCVVRVKNGKGATCKTAEA